jgi:uncharacterized damage-inducible protein DinB
VGGRRKRWQVLRRSELSGSGLSVTSSLSAIFQGTALNETVRFTFVGGGEGAMTRGEILLHIVNHTTYHHGFVADLFYQIPAQPPTTDLPVFLRDVPLKLE